MSTEKFIMEYWLERHGRTMEELAQAMGVSMARAQAIAKGRVWPRAREACAIRELTNLSLDHWVPKKPPSI